MKSVSFVITHLIAHPVFGHAWAKLTFSCTLIANILNSSIVYDILKHILSTVVLINLHVHTFKIWIELNICIVCMTHLQNLNPLYCQTSHLALNSDVMMTWLIINLPDLILKNLYSSLSAYECLWDVKSKKTLM